MGGGTNCWIWAGHRFWTFESELSNRFVIHAPEFMLVFDAARATLLSIHATKSWGTYVSSARADWTFRIMLSGHGALMSIFPALIECSKQLIVFFITRVSALGKRARPEFPDNHPRVIPFARQAYQFHRWWNIIAHEVLQSVSKVLNGALCWRCSRDVGKPIAPKIREVRRIASSMRVAQGHFRRVMTAELAQHFIDGQTSVLAVECNLVAQRDVFDIGCVRHLKSALLFAETSLTQGVATNLAEVSSYVFPNSGA